MLVLTRNKGESHIIHHNGIVIAEVELVEPVAGRARLGVTAAANIGIDRKELFEKRHPGALPKVEGGDK
jgi:sRNA-binding carbon storage regulator CsrA